MVPLAAKKESARRRFAGKIVLRKLLATLLLSASVLLPTAVIQPASAVTNTTKPSVGVPLNDVMDYKNSLLVEQPNGDFAFTIVRQFLFTAFSYHLQDALLSSSDERIRSIAEKAIKEVTYHLRHSSDWVTRLGDGTEESHQKVQDALNEAWMFTDDLFAMLPGDKLLMDEKIIPDFKIIRRKWNDTIKGVIEGAALKLPTETYMMNGGREAKHTEHLGYILADMQFLQRAYPGAKW